MRNFKSFIFSLIAFTLLSNEVLAANVENLFPSKVNMVRGSANTTDSTTTTLIAAQTGYKLYITGVQCKNSNAVTSGIVTLNDSASTVLIIPAIGGDNETYATPLLVAVGTALTFTSNQAIATVYCNAQGYYGN